MNDLERFRENCAIPYHNTKSKVSWMISEKRLQLQGSVEVQDWYRNFAVIPWPIRVRKVWVWVSLGMLLAWWAIKRKVVKEDVSEVVAYSGGSPVGALVSAYSGKPATLFGCPDFLYKPSEKALSLFDNCRFIDAPFDIVTEVPPWGTRGRNVKKLDQRPVTKPDWLSWLLWITGHCTEEYIQRLP